MEKINPPEMGGLYEGRILSDVDHLLNARIAPGVFREEVIEALRPNKKSLTQESAMPSAVTTTDREVIIERGSGKKIPMWLGRTAVEAAMSGYDFHEHESARKRIPYEVEEAADLSDLKPGFMNVFISPKMSEKDAPLEIAQQEHLGDDDAVRVSWYEQTQDGNLIMKVQSLLVKDVPLEAWVAMLSDENNPFGKSIPLDDAESALSILKVHRDLEVRVGVFPRGPVSIVEAVVPYIKDSKLRKKVITQVRRFHNSDQELLNKYAEDKAEELIAFDKELAESLATGSATLEVRRFIIGMQHNWSREDLLIIQKHQFDDAKFGMTRQLAAVLESAHQLLVLNRAAVLASVDELVEQGVDRRVLQEVIEREKLIGIGRLSGMNVMALTMQQNRSIAKTNIRPPGGGCPGKNTTQFDDSLGDPGGDVAGLTGVDGETKNSDDDPNSWKWSKGMCAVKSCPTRPGQTMVGPCSICKRCQKEFDKGRDPTKEEAPKVTGSTDEQVQTFGKVVLLGNEKQDKKELVGV